MPSGSCVLVLASPFKVSSFGRLVGALNLSRVLQEVSVVSGCQDTLTCTRFPLATDFRHLPLLAGDQNRRKYYSGWAQFIKLAKAYEGYVIKFPNAEKGVEVDIYAYRAKDEQPVQLDLDEGLIEVSEFDAVAVLPKHNITFHGIKSMVLSNFMELGNMAGAATTL